IGFCIRKLPSCDARGNFLTYVMFYNIRRNDNFYNISLDTRNFLVIESNMSEELDEILIPPEDMMGEAMLALNGKQRRFVCAALVFDCNMAQAYKFAGYDVTNDKSAQAAASRLAGRADVQAAIVEENHR